MMSYYENSYLHHAETMETFLKKIQNTFKNRAILIALILIIFLSLASSLPLFIHQALYTVSMLIKDVMLFALPITVGSFIAYTLIGFDKKAPLFILALVIFEGLSNFSSVWYSFFTAHSVSDILPEFSKLNSSQTEFPTLWKLPLSRPSFWSADKGTLIGLLFGFLALYLNNSRLTSFIYSWKKASNFILTKVFSPLIPLFILGFFAKMHQTGLFSDVLSRYSMLVLIMCLFLCGYMLFLIVLASNFTLKGIIKTFQNLLPAFGIAFSSGCSLSTMPWTIKGASRNLKNPELAEAIIPATTNIQQIGDCIVNTFLCFLLYKHFFKATPPITVWLSFSLMFTLARFTTAAVLGGAILIMIPIYESYLGFTAEMIAIIVAFNVLLDPIITSTNVLANGALCSLFEKMWMRLLSAFQKA
jgi:Sodium:dicarboxylate symporter family